MSILYGVRLIATTVFVLLASVSVLVQRPERGVSVLPLGLHWTRPLPFGEAFRIVIGDTRVLVAADSRIEALSWATSEPAWVSDAATIVPPVVHDGRVMLATGTEVQALSELTGRVEWRQTVGPVTIPLVYRSGWLLVIDADNRMRGIRAADGEVLWHADAPAAPWVLPPQVDGDHVFGLTADGRLTAWRITDGSVQWSVDATPNPIAALTAHGLLYVATNGRLTAYRQATGRRAWSYATEMPIISRLTADQTHVYMAVLDNSVRAHRASDGDMIWNHKVDARIVDGLTADGAMVLVPHSDGLVRFILSPTGRRAGQLNAASLEARGTTSLATAGYGPTLRVARMTVTDDARTIETFARKALPVTAATTLTGTPMLLTPPGGSRQ
jgi:outer membrane protein assembly factor BamB